MFDFRSPISAPVDLPMKNGDYTIVQLGLPTSL